MKERIKSLHKERKKERKKERIHFKSFLKKNTFYAWLKNKEKEILKE